MGGLDSAKESIGHLPARHSNIEIDELRYDGFYFIHTVTFSSTSSYFTCYRQLSDPFLSALFIVSQILLQHPFMQVCIAISMPAPTLLRILSVRG